MPYQSRRQTRKKEQLENGVEPEVLNTSDVDPASQKKQERQKATKNALKTGLKGAGAYVGGPLGAYAADKLANSKTGQKALNKGAQTLNKIPGIGRITNRVNKTGAVDAADKGIDLFSKFGGKNKISNKNVEVGGQDSSLPSSSSTGGEDDSSSKQIAGLPTKSKMPSFLEDKDKNKDNEAKGTAKVNIQIFKTVIFVFGPIIVVILLFYMVIAGVAGLFSDYEDAFGISQTVGEETGDVYFQASSEEQQKFFDRVNNVKLEYQANGKIVDPLKIVAVYHVLSLNGANLKYETMDDAVIRKIADAMLFDGTSYSEDTFKENLIAYIIPEYIPNTLAGEREQLADDILDYVSRYYNLIGREESSSVCASIGSCVYDIKGFALSNNGNVAKAMQIKDLKVRLMECGGGYGSGSYNTPIDQDLVNFEDYVAGVAYAEVGPDAHVEALKAQMVAARSYALARPTAMGNALGKKLEQENGEWILQISSCVADQVFCNINEGCSYMGGGDGQGGVVRSGIVPGAIRTRPPLPEGHPLRTVAAETQGEVLVNQQGYVISTGFLATEQRIFMSLASQGLNYKQILLQVYNQGDRNYGAFDIAKASCNNGSSSNCQSDNSNNNNYANWKQYVGPWINTPIGTSGNTIKGIGCLVTSVSMLIAKSGVPTVINNFNPGTFVEFLNSNGGFSGGNFNWVAATIAAPTFKYQNDIEVLGWSKKDKLNKIKEIVNQPGVYAVAEVKGDTGQHWVAIDSVTGDTIKMMDPGSSSSDMWSEYNWNNTSRIVYYKVG